MGIDHTDNCHRGSNYYENALLTDFFDLLHIHTHKFTSATDQAFI